MLIRQAVQMNSHMPELFFHSKPEECQDSWDRDGVARRRNPLSTHDLVVFHLSTKYAYSSWWCDDWVICISCPDFGEKPKYLMKWEIISCWIIYNEIRKLLHSELTGGNEWSQAKNIPDLMICWLSCLSKNKSRLKSSRSHILIK